MSDRRRPQQRFDRSIVDGPLSRAVWKLAWPAMLTNMIGGLQGIVDQAMVGHYVGHAGNAAIGVSMQLFLLVIVFVASVFTGMGVLVARFVGANEAEKVNRTVYQAFLTAVFMAVGVMAPVGYFAAPVLLDTINAAPEVQAEALSYIRIVFVFSIGMLLFFMMNGALRAAGDARTPLRLGVLMTALNVVLNVVLIRGLGPIPSFGTTGAAMGTAIASGLVAVVFLTLLFSDRLVIRFARDMSWKPDWRVIRELFRFGLPAGFQGIVMNVAGVLLLRFVGSLEHSAEAQAAYAVGYTELFALITWTSVGLMGATAAVAGQNLGALGSRPAAPGRRRSRRPSAWHVRNGRRSALHRYPAAAAGHLRARRGSVVRARAAAPELSGRIGFLRHRGADVHRRSAGHRRHAQSAVHFHGLAGRRADRLVHLVRGRPRAAARRHLAGHRAGTHDPRHPERHPLPPGPLARDRRRYRTVARLGVCAAEAVQTPRRASAGAARGDGVPASGRRGFGAQPRLK